MANKREFKKAVNEIGGVLTEEMLYAFVNVEKADKEAISQSIGMVMDAVENATKHANVFFDKGVKAFENKREYSKEKAEFFQLLFNKINKEFDESINAALAKFNAALPQEVKDGLKASVAE